mgnify:CR=1 FL=1
MEQDLAKLQEQFDVEKWYESAWRGYDMCGNYPRCRYCERYLEYPCAHAQLMMEEIEGANGTPIAEKKERSLRVLSLKNGDDAPRYCILSFVRRQG